MATPFAKPLLKFSTNNLNTQSKDVKVGPKPPMHKTASMPQILKTPSSPTRSSIVNFTFRSHQTTI